MWRLRAACCSRSSSAFSRPLTSPRSKAPDAHEISLALIPTRPSFPPHRHLDGGIQRLGCPAWAVAGLSSASWPTARSAAVTMSAACWAAVFCTGPTVSRRALNGLSVADYAARKPHSALAEQLRALRAGLSLWPDRPRIVAVTAARQKEGKTTITQALGRLAAMNGERVMALDCDVRQPVRHDQSATWADRLPAGDRRRSPM